MSLDYSVYEEMTASEKQVADYLKELQLWWHYESPVFLKDEKERPRVWTPDFYIPKLGIDRSNIFFLKGHVKSD